MSKILGISASLRNARLGFGSKELVAELKGITEQQQLTRFIDSQVKIRAGEVELARLLSKPGLQGLSNSEAAVAVALWGALQQGADIDYVSLADFFPPNGKIRNADKLKELICSADGIILSGPVYFGDRGSLAQSFIDFCSADADIRKNIRGKIYGGLSVGAKRNGGQETTLIYQMLDMINLNMLAVGNDSETSSQYGGTAVAGDIGTFSKDDYGFDTCRGTGRKVAHVADLLTNEDRKIRVDLWLMQDNKDRKGLELFQLWINEMNELRPNVEFKIWDIADSNVTRCIACDLCPIKKGPSQEYRCIITTEEDFFVKNHQELIKADAVLLCAYSPEDRSELVSQYQSFMERTRYLRRDDYLFTDILMAPFVISELNARQNLHLRMMTSGIRHNTIMHHPLIAMVGDYSILNWKNIISQGLSFVDTASRLPRKESNVVYVPLGYTISNLSS